MCIACFFVYSVVSVLFWKEEFKWCQPAHHKLWNQQRHHFSPHSTAIINDKSAFLRKISSGISDVVIASVHSKKTRLKKLMMMSMKMMMMMIIVNKLQETTFLAVARN